MRRDRRHGDAVLWHRPTESGNTGGQRIIGYVFIGMDSGGVLAQVVEAREAAAAVALVGTLARVLADVANEVFATGETEVAVVITRASEAICFFLLFFCHTAGSDLVGWLCL